MTDKPSVKTLGFLLLFSTAFAKISPEWVDAPAYAPNIRVLIHRSEKNSTFSVQAPAANDARVQKLFKESSANQKVAELLPNDCFQLKREDLESRQTWCRTPNGQVRVFIELGDRKLRDGERLELQLKALSEAK